MYNNSKRSTGNGLAVISITAAFLFGIPALIASVVGLGFALNVDEWWVVFLGIMICLGMYTVEVIFLAERFDHELPIIFLAAFCYLYGIVTNVLWFISATGVKIENLSTAIRANPIVFLLAVVMGIVMEVAPSIMLAYGITQIDPKKREALTEKFRGGSNAPQDVRNPQQGSR